MKTKHQVHNLIILDESGSMQSIKNEIINGFNEVVQTIKGVEAKYPEQEHFVSLVSFNGMGITPHHFNAPAKSLFEINGYFYRPAATTPLHDAIGLSVSRLERLLEDQTDYHVLVTILTDGLENASREYSGKDIKAKIAELKDKNWTFTYIGAEHDVFRTARDLDINNVKQFSKDKAAMDMMFREEREARFNYSSKIRQGKDTGKDFYVKED